MKGFSYITILLIFLVELCWSQNIHSYSDARPYGGWKEVKEWIRNEIVYPEKELKEKIEGKVYIKFTVMESGMIEDIKIIQSVNENLDREALRIIKKIQWIPAISYEIAIKTSKIMEIEFDIRRYHKWVKRRGYHKVEYPYEPFDTTQVLFDASETDVPPQIIFSDTTLNIQRFIEGNLKYPEEAFRRNLNGDVQLIFTVEQNGHITNIYPAKPLGGGCTEEAIRLLKLTKWHPALNENKAVRSILKLDVTFVLPVLLNNN